MKVVTVPAQLDERSFDLLAESLLEAGEARILVDARHLRWVDPSGMLGLLAVGRAAAEGGERVAFQPPESAEVTSYLARMGFFDFAPEYFDVRRARRAAEPGGSDILLEITPIESHADVHTVVDRVHDRAMAILSRQLRYRMSEAMQFSVILSEVCQNIIEHAQSGGWVAAQTYARLPELERRVVKISVVDLGIGFRGSLASELAARYGERWNDAAALEAAFLHGLTRFHDPGRGQGLQQIRKRVGAWDGRIRIRSGSARISQVPSWDNETLPLEENLAHFKGTQISIVLPERETSEQVPSAAATRTRRAEGRRR